MKHGLVILLLFFIHFSFAQVTGDFQTRVSGNWSDFNSWNRYNGTAWVAAVSGQTPTTTSAVTVQAGHTISVDNSAAVCNDLIFPTNTSRIAFTNTGSILTVYGNLTFVANINHINSWTAGAKLVFAGGADQ
ncbi:MAG TPA: hypothetical protein PKE63_14330, partial [Lacibacter sp.]|nr:hypothetical protein [Lacibacter sp.]